MKQGTKIHHVIRNFSTGVLQRKEGNLIWADPASFGFMSFANKVYAFATKVANKDQKAFLVEEVKRQNFRTKSNR